MTNNKWLGRRLRPGVLVATFILVTTACSSDSTADLGTELVVSESSSSTANLQTTTIEPATATTEPRPLDQFGACHSYLETTTIFAADASQASNMTRAIMVFAPHSVPTVSYDLSAADSGIAHPALFASGAEAKSRACSDVSYQDTGNEQLLEAVSGQVEVKFEYGADGGYPLRVQMTATNLVFSNGFEVDDFVTPWLKIGFTG